MMNTNALQRWNNDLNAMAKETVTVAAVGNMLYAFGSELAILRIFATYQSRGAVHNPRVRMSYNPSATSWVLALNTE